MLPNPLCPRGTLTHTKINIPCTYWDLSLDQYGYQLTILASFVKGKSHIFYPFSKSCPICLCLFWNRSQNRRILHRSRLNVNELCHCNVFLILTSFEHKYVHKFIFYTESIRWKNYEYFKNYTKIFLFFIEVKMVDLCAVLETWKHVLCVIQSN